MMISKLRIWRVVPTNEFGVQAPTYFVETQDKELVKAINSAKKLAEDKSGLSRFKTWTYQVEKLNVRKDVYGRYVKYHQ